MARSALLNVMVQAALKAGRRLSRDFGELENLQISRKGPGDFVSNADMQAEKIIKEELQKARPNFGFLMEESGEQVGVDKSHRWIVDPLDGTTNFLHGIPFFAISIALEHEDRIIAGVIYNPATDDLFVAERGRGAFHNDRRMRVAARDDFHDCVIATGVPHLGRGKHKHYLPQLEGMMNEVSGLRRMGAASLDLAYVAAGRFDGYWEEWLSPWDIAAGVIMVREAGGFVTDIKGGDKVLETGSLIAANEAIRRHIQHTLKKSQAS
ncbi:myo-inositol-1(or 4)-monophosphatase [Cohaesibacter sp. ES.047]|uniref:inositol monophosphatase family protein n=1 Tax=Cohaesibacter sp. ES.047 TaxID=1798205 RepID=UPI000BB6ABDB|nr:inositol monophosphatase family protein [Cohaesibacter sp. ES.047]SNY90962.1 myo-inositol-1(or 4)-monophosphatase [Cohaesibacter sp. ES.047]